MMEMSFHGGFNITNFLFEGLNVSSPGAFAGLCLILATSVCILEALKLIQAFLYYKHHQSPFAQCEPVNEGSPLVRPLNMPPSLEYIKRRKIYLQIGQSCVHFLEITLAYLLMLAVMSYNLWVLLAIALASGFGYFLFGKLRYFLVTAPKVNSQEFSPPPEEPVNINR